jgi:hypothetical protein
MAMTILSELEACTMPTKTLTSNLACALRGKVEGTTYLDIRSLVHSADIGVTSMQDRLT